MQRHAERSKPTGATVLSRALEAKGGEVPPEGARFILDLGLREQDKKRMLDMFEPAASLLTSVREVRRVSS